MIFEVCVFSISFLTYIAPLGSWPSVTDRLISLILVFVFLRLVYPLYVDDKQNVTGDEHKGSQLLHAPSP